MVAVLVVLGALALLYLFARFLATRRNRAGISTSMTSRAASIGGLATRSAARKAALRMRQVVSSKARKAELMRRACARGAGR